MGKDIKEDPAEAFLKTVTDQIAYKPMREMVCRELNEHIEDRTEEYEGQGMNHEEARRSAVIAMGDAISIGTELNEVHQVRKTPALMVVSLILILSGFAWYVWIWWNWAEDLKGVLYYILFILLPGLVILGAVVWKGYAVFIRYRVKLVLLMGACFLARMVTNGMRQWNLGFLASVDYMILICLGIAYAVILYQFRQSGIRVIAAVIAVSGAVFTLSYRLFWYNTASAAVVMLLCTFGTICFAVYRGIVKGVKSYLYGTLLAGMLITGVLAVPATSARMDFQQFARPEASVRNRLDDTYNSILIKELLDKTPLTHGLSLTPEEMMSYGSGEWYFLSANPDGRGNSWQVPYTESEVTLWDILPQHYDNNYLIAVVIFRFGWMAGLLLLAAIGAFYVMVFSCIWNTRGQLTSVVAFAGGMCLLWQGILYILGNFGYQYATFTNLPLVSEGRVSVVFNMLILGLVISAYRYDHVMDETLIS